MCANNLRCRYPESYPCPWKLRWWPGAESNHRHADRATPRSAHPLTAALRQHHRMAVARAAREARDGGVEIVVDVGQHALRVAQADDLRIAGAPAVVFDFIQALPLLQRAHGALQHAA